MRGSSQSHAHRTSRPGGYKLFRCPMNDVALLPRPEATDELLHETKLNIMQTASCTVCQDCRNKQHYTVDPRYVTTSTSCEVPLIP